MVCFGNFDASKWYRSCILHSIQIRVNLSAQSEWKIPFWLFKKGMHRFEFFSLSLSIFSLKCLLTITMSGLHTHLPIVQSECKAFYSAIVLVDFWGSYRIVHHTMRFYVHDCETCPLWHVCACVLSKQHFGGVHRSHPFEIDYSFIAVL